MLIGQNATSDFAEVQVFLIASHSIYQSFD